MELKVKGFSKGVEGDLSQIGASRLVGELLQGALINPVTDFLARPSKGFRAELVKVGLHFSSTKAIEEGTELEAICELVEYLHSGSLVVDDIQDNSEERRGKPTLHKLYGVPTALNAGNWMYFWPLANVPTWGLSAEQENEIYRLSHETLKKAHYGQALDVSVEIDHLSQKDIPELCETVIALKSGALTELAVGLGAVLGMAKAIDSRALRAFGKSFGIGLQYLDDLGNFSNPRLGPKQFEDLRLKRPSWVWAFLAKELPHREFRKWLKLVNQLPETEDISVYWKEKDLLPLAMGQVRQQLHRSLEKLILHFGEKTPWTDRYTQISELIEKLMESYGPKK